MPPSEQDLHEHYGPPGLFANRERVFWLSVRRAMLMLADAIKDRYLPR